ncbi:hypothetical protein BH20ACT23_BH20ACT23_13790 [soil metagenome]
MEIRAVDDVLVQEVDDEMLAARAAEDITAHVFFKALIKADEWRGEGSYRSWLYGIARNAVSTWRNQKSRHAVVLEVVPHLEDPDPTPPVQVVIGEERDLIWKRVAELPDAQRKAVVLRYLKEHSIDEIASITRRTKGAVRILLHRARCRLRRQMESIEEETIK